MQTVAAGLIWREGKLLIAQRRDCDGHALEWEFPGGKVEPGETAERALIRELQEELGIAAIRYAEFTRYEYAYPGKAPLLLIFFHVTRYEGVIRSDAPFAALQWEYPANLAGHNFLAGDLRLIQLLRKVDVNQVE